MVLKSRAEGVRRRALLRAAGALALPGIAAPAVADGMASPASTDEFSEVARWSIPGYDDRWGAIWRYARTLHDVTVVDEYAYCAFWEAGTWILDVSDPTSPEFVGRAGHYSLEELEELTADVSRQRARLEAPGNAHYAHAEGGRLAVGAEGWDDPYTDARGPGGIRLYDVSDPSDPEEVSAIPPPRAENEARPGTWVTAHNFELRDDRLYSSWYQGGVKVHDVSDPSNPELLAWWRDPSVARFWTAQVAAGGTFVASSYDRGETEGRLYVFPDRPGRQPDPPSLVDRPPTRTPTSTPENGTTPGPTTTPNPTPPAEEPFEPLGSVAVEGAAEAVVGPDGETVYVAATDGFVVVDVSDPTNPTVLAERRGLLADHPDGPLEAVLDVAVDGDRLLVPAPARRGSPKGLLLYDVSDPADPRRVDGFHEFPSRIHNADLADGYAFLTANELPDQPMAVVEVPSDGEATPTATSGGTTTTGRTGTPPAGDGTNSGDGRSVPGFGALAALAGLGVGAYRYLRDGTG
ncbi:hypothetical protein BRD00_06355 [Halobacteriales archaeon QS_8_69_26]|nr:MAG: hypothetical protein BRD00_06355 [Halobacteriales archaeon QS_8_69_26]